jgi:superfamily I DNA and/or RNA helicase/very-short-patch-repair endonuclease
MELTVKFLKELQNRLKIGNSRGVHLNAIPGKSLYKFDIKRLSHISESIPTDFINALLTEYPLKFKISWKNNVKDFEKLSEDVKIQLIKNNKAFENLVNQTDSIESEKGINSFGFGYPILLKKNQSDDKLTAAPLLIWSMKVKSTKEFNTWEISRSEDDPIYLNEVLINHLASDAKIKLDQIPSEMLEDGLINRDELKAICIDIIKAVNTSTSDNGLQKLESSVGTINAIQEKSAYEQILKSSSEALIEFGGVFSIFEVQKQSIIEDYENLIEINEIQIETNIESEIEFQPISSVETDPSQQSILQALKERKNCLIQGPPGTGKSQTLTSILVNALENHKKTLVVCEKRTALEVLNNALINLGLETNCILIKDVQKDRKMVVDAVRDRIEKRDYKRYNYSVYKEQLTNLIKKINSQIDKINRGHAKLDVPILGEKNWSALVAEILRENRKNPDSPKIDFEDLDLAFSNQEYSELFEIVENGHSLFERFGSSQLNLFNSNKFENTSFYQLEKDISELIDSYKEELKRIQKITIEARANYTQQRNQEVKQLIEQMSFESKKIVDLINQRGIDIPSLDQINLNLTSFILSYLLKGGSKSLYSSKKEILTSLDRIKTWNDRIPSKLKLDLTYTTVEKNIDQILLLAEQVENLYPNYQAIIDLEFNSLDISNGDSLTKEIINLIQECEELNKLITKDEWLTNKNHVQTIKGLTGHLEEIILGAEKSLHDHESGLIIDYDWYKFYHKLSVGQKNLVDSLKKSENWISCFIINYLNSLLSRYVNDEMLLDDQNHKDLSFSLKWFKEEQLKYIRQYWTAKQLNAAGEFVAKNPDVLVENVYNKRSSTKYKRQSLRQIIKYDPDFFTSYFPIVLTTPEVCSTLFKGMNNYFDIVVFDEASQLKVEDNLPALLKGKQVVIAGDEHQMPPSNYFSKVFDGDIEDEDELQDEDQEKSFDKEELLLSAESLLEWASELDFEKRHLDFHYRSKHPYLIDFSNAAFYNNRLKPLPNKSDYIPIEYFNVDGTFVDHQNELEADRVISIIEHQIVKNENGKYPSLGIATFNITQRNLIISKIREKASISGNTRFSEKISELEAEGMFVKNLENIQGDERDVIIISTTYGINKHGKFVQNFGQINQSKGYKLLNVIITRAKHKIFICTSIPEKNILDYNSYLITEGNNRKGAFYAYLAYCKAVSEKNDTFRNDILKSLAKKSVDEYDHSKYGLLESPFEEEVYQYLIDSIGEEHLFPQMEFGGFRIDLVYDPKIAGIPKVAIECDGAKYHSSNEAYVYDKHRQKILENFGFVFHRIWSTNWWRNPKREAEKLIDFINSVSSGKFQTTVQDEKFNSMEMISDVKELIVTPKEVYLDDVSDILNANYLVEDTVENFTSSWIRDAKYFSSDGKTGYVVIKADQGFLVNYNVPIETWIEFKNAKFKSLGSYYHKYIKYRY